MKAKRMKQLRLQLIIMMVAVAMVVIAGEVINVYGYWMKGAAVMLGASAFGLFKRWKAADLLPRLEDI